MLTYSEVAQRAVRATLVASALAFWAIALFRLQLAIGLSTSTAYDLNVWGAMGGVAVTALLGAGWWAWMRVSDYFVRHRDQLVPVLVWVPSDPAPEHEVVTGSDDRSAPSGRHRRRPGASA